MLCSSVVIIATYRYNCTVIVIVIVFLNATVIVIVIVFLNAGNTYGYIQH